MGFFKPNIKKLEEKVNIDELIKALDYQDDPEIRCKAAQALGRLKNKKSLKPLVIALQDISQEVRKNVVIALGEIGGRNVLRVLCKYSAKADYSVRVSVDVTINNIVNNIFSVPALKTKIVPLCANVVGITLKKINTF